MMGGRTNSLMNFLKEVYYYQQYESTFKKTLRNY